MPCGFSIKKIIALVNALAKLHNFCINKQDGTPDSILAVDTEHLMHNEGGSIEMVSNDTHDVLVLYLRASWTVAIIFKTCHMHIGE
jgi:hypothetical protein